MKTIAVANAAGSAGKTTSVVTLAALLAPTKRVVVIDLDGQANSTQWLGINPSTLKHTVGEVLLGRCTPNEALMETNTENVRLLPSASSVNADIVNLRDEVGREMRLKSALRKIDADIVLLDCPGTIGLVTIVAMVAADVVVTVTQPTRKELEGISELEATIESVASSYDSDLKLGGIIPCIVPPPSAGRLYVDGMELVRESYGKLVSPSIRRAVAAAGAYAHSEPLPDFAPSEGITEDYRKVLAHLQALGVL
ncbi:hypothetical protein EVU97_13865 [Dermacoccus sp. 147Ba]|uniref:ParA family protein n=1 Tax=Dermacoccus sp. 147Ba TaxID=2510111 RepID=UPI00101D1D24|nr:AAA family ATPase [Dermacoccus sp. 147Ba]RYI20606.1 hypothetical protein EVU97_13865 [Dermacoccus sp. 147Ba]